MTDELSKLIKAVRDRLQLESHKHCVSVSIHFNSNGYEITENLRSPSSLKREGITMRNFDGAWIDK